MTATPSSQEDHRENPLISIIVSCYNHESFVGEALDGVLSQTYAPLDIVILDDCSTDRTSDIIRAKLANHPDRTDVRFIRNETNIGMRANSELGLSLTRGSFVSIVCGDDILLPDMISEVAKVWQEENVSMVITNAIYIDEESQLLDRTFRDPQVRADDSFETLARDGANACCFGPCNNFERELYDTFGWPPASLEAIDIIAPFCAYLLKGARFIEKPLFKYRVHSRNTSHSLIAEQLKGIQQLEAEEHMFYIHIAHALHMQDVIRKVKTNDPERYTELAERIHPLLLIQLEEMAKKMVRTRVELSARRRELARPEDRNKHAVA
jgi:glycosyltransferase involved in cell wall biosynthesis